MDCPQMIPPSGTPATHYKPHRSHHASSSLRNAIMKTETEKSQSRSQSHFQRHCGSSHHAICIEAALDHNTEIDAAITEAAHDILTPPTEDIATDLTVTPLINHICRSFQHRSSSGY